MWNVKHVGGEAHGPNNCKKRAQHATPSFWSCLLLVVMESIGFVSFLRKNCPNIDFLDQVLQMSKVKPFAECCGQKQAEKAGLIKPHRQMTRLRLP
jgi:hypothetical protein